MGWDIKRAIRTEVTITFMERQHSPKSDGLRIDNSSIHSLAARTMSVLTYLTGNHRQDQGSPKRSRRLLIFAALFAGLASQDRKRPETS